MINNSNNKQSKDHTLVERYLTLILALLTVTVATVVDYTSSDVGGMGHKYQVSGNEVIQKAFVYTKLQVSTPFNEFPWKKINIGIREQPGFINKTWLSAVENNSIGGVYSIESIENANKFVTKYFPSVARDIGVSQTTRVFDAVIVSEASRGLNSVYFGSDLDTKPGAFVYTEAHLNVSF